MALNVVIAYDISSDNTRAQVAAMITSWGDRIQRSVYECLLDTEDLEDLLARIETIINHNFDTIHVLPQCAKCSSSAQHIGQATKLTPNPYWIL